MPSLGHPPETRRAVRRPHYDSNDNNNHLNNAYPDRKQDPLPPRARPHRALSRRALPQPPLSAFWAPEDEDRIEAFVKLKTASRLLYERVYTESGTQYGDVVD